MYFCGLTIFKTMATKLLDYLAQHQEFAGGEDFEVLAQAIEHLQIGEVDLALDSLLALKATMQSDQKRAAKKHLRVLMENVLLCLEFPEKMHEFEWIEKIHEHRDRIAYYMVTQPAVNQAFLEHEWIIAFQKAKKMAEIEWQIRTDTLTWEQVFEVEYGAIIVMQENTENGGE